MKRSSALITGAAVVLSLLLATLAAGQSTPAPAPPDGGATPFILGCRPLNCTMPDGCPGTEACDGNGNNLPCDYNGNNKTCTACGQTGYQTCPVTDNVCHVTNTSQGCTACSTSGTQTCNNIPGGNWNACVVPPRGCGGQCNGSQACVNNAWGACTGCVSSFTCHTSEGDLCGTTGTITCDSTCQPTSPCNVAEVCNNCDDNGDGNVDEGLHCSCGL